MIRNKIYVTIITILVILSGFNAVDGKEITANETLKTKILDWSIDSITLKYDAGIVKSNSYKESKKCGNISFKLSQLISFRNFNLIISPKLFHSNDSNFLSDGMTFSLDCTTQVDLNKNDVKFNTTTQQWELPPDIRDQYAQNSTYQGNKIYQLHAKNAFGWLYTLTNIDTRDGGYIKQAIFCLFNDKKTKQFCGSGISQYISNKKQLGTTKFDYTPTLIKTLNTAQFLDDK